MPSKQLIDTPDEYLAAIDQCRDDLIEQIPAHPQLLTVADPRDAVPGCDCGGTRRRNGKWPCAKQSASGRRGSDGQKRHAWMNGNGL